MDWHGFILRVSNRTFQNFNVNQGPLSNMISQGNPCSLKTKQFASRDISLAKVLVVQGMKVANIVNWSTTTIIKSYPFDFGSLTMKSIEIELHGESGICRGFKSPWGFCWDGLLHIQLL